MVWACHAETMFFSSFDLNDSALVDGNFNGTKLESAESVQDSPADQISCFSLLLFFLFGFINH